MLGKLELGMLGKIIDYWLRLRNCSEVDVVTPTLEILIKLRRWGGFHNYGRGKYLLTFHDLNILKPELLVGTEIFSWLGWLSLRNFITNFDIWKLWWNHFVRLSFWHRMNAWRFLLLFSYHMWGHMPVEMIFFSRRRNRLISYLCLVPFCHLSIYLFYILCFFLQG